MFAIFSITALTCSLTKTENYFTKAKKDGYAKGVAVKICE